WTQSEHYETGWEGVIPGSWTHPGIGSSDDDVRTVDLWGKTLALGNDSGSGLWGGNVGKWAVNVESPWVADPAPPHRVADIAASTRLDELEHIIDLSVNHALNGWGAQRGLPDLNWRISSGIDVDIEGVPLGDLAS